LERTSSRLAGLSGVATLIIDEGDFITKFPFYHRIWVDPGFEGINRERVESYGLSPYKKKPGCSNLKSSSGNDLPDS
jgi:hypothetical protein